MARGRARCWQPWRRASANDVLLTESGEKNIASYLSDIDNSGSLKIDGTRPSEIIVDKSELAATLDKELRAAGFKKTGSTWYSSNILGVLLFNLQRSQWGNQYYINLASAPVEIPIEGLPKPKHYKCPVNTRLSALYSHLEQKLKNVFDLEDVSINDTDRTASIREIVNDYAVPFLRKMDGLSNIRRSIDDGMYPQGLITGKLRDALDQQ